MATQVASLEAIFSADTSQFLSGVNTVKSAMTGLADHIGGGLDNIGRKMSSMGSSLMPLSLALGGIGAMGIKTFSSFENALAEISARTGATADDMEQVRATAMKMGADTAFSSTQAAQAILQLLASGYDLKQTFKALPAVLNAAAAGGMDLGYTADIVTDILAMFNLKAEEAGMVADVLAQGAAASSAEINDLAQGFGNVGPMAAQFGLSVADTTAILAAFAERGIKGAEAGTQLRSMLNNMTRDTDDVKGAWDKLGISLYDTNGKVRPLISVFAEMRTQMAGMSDKEKIELIKTLAGTYGQLGLSVLTASPAMDDMLSLMGQQTGASTVAAARLNTLSGRFETLRGSVEALLINAMGPLINDYLKPGIEQVTAYTNQLSEWIVLNPELSNGIVAALAGLTALGPSLLIGGKMLSLFGVGLQAVGGLLGALLSPIGLIVGALAGLYIAWKKNLFGIRSLMKPVTDRLSAGFEAMGRVANVFTDQISKRGLAGALENLILSPGFAASILEGFGVSEEAAFRFSLGLRDAYQTLKDALGEIGNFIQTRVIPPLAMVGNWVVNEFAPAMASVFVNNILPILKDFAKFLGQVWAIVSPSLEQLYDWFVGKALPAILKFISGTVIPVIGKWLDVMRSIWETVAPYLLQMLDWFVNTGLPAIVGFISSVVVPALAGLINILAGIWDFISPTLAKVYDWFVTTALPAISNFITNTAVPAVQGITNAISGIWEAIKPALESVYNWFMVTGLPGIRNALLWFKVYIWTPLVNGLASIWDTVKPGLEAVYNFFKDKFQWVIDNVIKPLADRLTELMGLVEQAQQMLSGGTTSLTQGKTNIQPGISGDRNPWWHFGLAAGGPINSPRLVGEKGPEIFWPSSQGTIIPNDKIGSNSTNITIQVSITPDTIRQYPNANEYAQTVKSGLDGQVLSELRKRGGGVTVG